MYTDTLTRIRNAQAVRKETVKMPFSKMDLAVLELLKDHKYIEEVQKKGRHPKRVLEVKLAYQEDGTGRIDGVHFLSKQSRHLYSDYKNLIRRKRHGLTVLSTSQGIKSARDAFKERIGGEVLFEIW
ncbi:MAG: 30S ribosomal protein S8 [Candidatus Harrisonbacteria bacterium CG10_big_fil_rev_8_21_14_0_10_42_17]|uniref:Small ribosomal subunit protein uS8 n=1 Tax=Candidatus Harrisonbacteria bacterium CG10_big_fil_rev_8_21_14_0_10_42_17 TaxID=1974584 RepID=A0A2M6WHN4_9BACT|nr:MAG: 30S ribosomal protein S8 [Candidatus Harrisonbacteria bacterium CG10_big_fil_rev_8_21_14_0_10_42_17]